MNPEFQEFFHTVKENSDDESFGHGSDHHLRSGIERPPVHPRPTFPASGLAYYHDNQHPSVYTENFAGFGSHGAHLPKSRPDPLPVNHGATSSNPIHPMYNQSPLYFSDATARFPPYTENHFNQKNLAVQIESALANDYDGSSASSYQATPRGSLILDSRIGRDLPPLPPIPSQPGEISPFANPRSEPAPNLGSRFKNDLHRSTNTVSYGDKETYYGYS